MRHFPWRRICRGPNAREGSHAMPPTGALVVSNIVHTILAVISSPIVAKLCDRVGRRLHSTAAQSHLGLGAHCRRPPNWGGLPNGGPNICRRSEIPVFGIFACILICEGYFNKPLPPKGPPRPPATFTGGFFPHLPFRPISFLDSPSWDVSKPFPLAQIHETCPSTVTSPDLDI